MSLLTAAVRPPFGERADVTPAPASIGNSTPVKAAKLMVVDDEPTNVKIVQRLLELEGYTNFVSTTDSRAALAIMEEERPDCVLLDLMMPFISGLDLLDGMRQDPVLRHMPVIILTAVTDRKVRAQALELGATDFLCKPIDPTEMAPRLANVLAAKSYYDQLLEVNRELESVVRLRDEELCHLRREVERLKSRL
jgi:putative two-component system response regulator